MGWGGHSPHLRAFLVVPVVPPSCCLRLAPRPFPLLPAAIPPLKRRQITFNEPWGKHHVDTEIPWGPTHPVCICVTPQEDFLPKILDFTLVLKKSTRHLTVPEHWVLAISSNESSTSDGQVTVSTFVCNKLQLLVYFLRVWHKCIFTHSDPKHPQLKRMKTTVWVHFFSIQINTNTHKERLSSL